VLASSNEIKTHSENASNAQYLPNIAIHVSGTTDMRWPAEKVAIAPKVSFGIMK
jgi:hypothetical protein